MSIVNFAIPKTLEKQIDQTIKQKGFASKAEFFRFAALHFINVIDKPFVTEKDRFDYLTDEIEKSVIKRYKGKKLPSLEEQLVDV